MSSFNFGQELRRLEMKEVTAGRIQEPGGDCSGCDCLGQTCNSSSGCIVGRFKTHVTYTICYRS